MESFVTTVKLDKELYTQFKEINIRGKISFQDFVNFCLDKYIKDDVFRADTNLNVCKMISDPNDPISPQPTSRKHKNVLSNDGPFTLSTPTQK